MRRSGRRTGPRPRAGRMEGGREAGEPGTHLHLHSAFTPHPSSRAPWSSWRVPPGEGQGQDRGHQSVVGRGPATAPQRGHPSPPELSPPWAPRRAGRRLHLALARRGGCHLGRTVAAQAPLEWGPWAECSRQAGTELVLHRSSGGTSWLACSKVLVSLNLEVLFKNYPAHRCWVSLMNVLFLLLLPLLLPLPCVGMSDPRSK